jgi:hypothetical protein
MFSLTHLAHYGLESLRDWVKFHPIGAGLASRALAAAGRLPGGKPERSLALLVRAARACRDPERRRRLEAQLRDRSATLDPGTLDWHRLSTSPTDRRDLPKALILKPPVSAEEKGVLYVTFEDQWLRLLRSGRAAAVAEQYDLLLGPTWSPPHDVPLLVAARMWPGPLYTLLSNFDDADTMRALSDRLVPIPLLASSWVDPDAYRDYLGAPREHDIVMVANFAPYKRHWLFFEMLRDLPRRYRVLLVGRPVGRWTEQLLLNQARAFGVHDRFELRSRLTYDAVIEALCRARVSLIFSRQEGSCIAVAESLFADTPVGLLEDARVGSKAWVNASTGRLLSLRRLAHQVQDFVETAPVYRPRPWALAHISCHHSYAILNRYLREDARRRGRPWTCDLLPFYQNALPRYLAAEDERAAAPWYEDFAHRYGLRLGPAAATAAPAEAVELSATASTTPCSGS